MQNKNKTIKVAIQGGYGSFHESACRKFFKDILLEIIPCLTFQEQFAIQTRGESDCILMAIENSLVGSLLQNYSLLKDSGLFISGEVFLRIEQHLAAIAGQHLSEIKEIYSHPVAIGQCSSFLNPLRALGIRIISSDDTALSAQMIRDRKLKNVAAICSDIAAEMNNLEIIAENIEAHQQNFTRFLIISEQCRKTEFLKKPVNKASLCFSLPHIKGNLSKLLSVLAYYNNNLTKIQSLPVIGKAWEYLFYVDLMFENYDHYRQSLETIKFMISELQILGEYPNGE
jgi:prephenate dehydratase